jgi:hypothetical protein
VLQRVRDLQCFGDCIGTIRVYSVQMLHALHTVRHVLQNIRDLRSVAVRVHVCVCFARLPAHTPRIHHHQHPPTMWFRQRSAAGRLDGSLKSARLLPYSPQISLGQNMRGAGSSMMSSCVGHAAGLHHTPYDPYYPDDKRRTTYDHLKGISPPL